MGGIIVTNAVGRSVLTGIADGAISIGGVFIISVIIIMLSLSLILLRSS